MFSAIVHMTTNFERIEKAAARAAYWAWAKSAYRIMRDAQSTILINRRASPPGTPPHTGRRKQLRVAIQYSASKDDAVVGPRGSWVDESMRVHEFGGFYKGHKYPARPFMGPALSRELDQFAGEFSGQIGQ